MSAPLPLVARLENHGLLDNYMWDPERNADFAFKSQTAIRDPAWFAGAEPIWVRLPCVSFSGRCLARAASDGYRDQQLFFFFGCGG